VDFKRILKEFELISGFFDFVFDFTSPDFFARLRKLVLTHASVIDLWVLLRKIGIGLNIF